MTRPGPAPPWGWLWVCEIRDGLSVLYLWYMVAVSLYMPDPRDTVEEEPTKIVRVVQGM